jgi:hypothetical protein
MIGKQQSIPRWLKILTPLALGLGTVLGDDFTVMAQNIPSSHNQILAQVGVRSSPNGLKSLTITPPPGSHIPLPEENYYHQRYNSHYHQRRDDCDDRSRDRHHGKTVIIINPPVYNRSTVNIEHRTINIEQ